MSDINIEKDDQATQEMLDMMSELSDDLGETPEISTEVESDHALETEENLPSISETPDEISDDESSLNLEDIDALMAEIDTDVETQVEVVTPSEPPIPEDTELDTELDNELDAAADENATETDRIEEALPQESSAHLAAKDLDSDTVETSSMEEMEDIEAFMEQAPSSVELDDQLENEINTEASLTAIADEPESLSADEQPLEADTISDEPLEMDALDDIESIDESLPVETDNSPEDESNLSEDVMEAEQSETDEMTAIETESLPETIDDSLPDTDAMDDSIENTDVDQDTANDTETMNTELGDNDSDNPIVELAAQSVSSMEDAIQIDQEIQEIASQVKNTAQEATQLALATSQKAHASAEKTQQAIEATFAAAERAFEAAKNAGYNIDLEALETQLSPADITQLLTEIQDKNRRLKEINQNIQTRIAELKA